MKIYEVFLKLAELMTGTAISGQLARDCLWLVSALFGFGLVVLIALMPLLILREMVGKSRKGYEREGII